MTFEQFAEIVRDWQRGLPPEQAHSTIESLLPIAVANPREVVLDDLLAMVANWQRAPKPERKAEPDVVGTSPQRQAPRRKAKSRSDHQVKPKHNDPPAGQDSRGRSSKKELANGPKLGEQVLAAADLADISERTLIAAADSLGVRAPSASASSMRR